MGNRYEQSWFLKLAAKQTRYSSRRSFLSKSSRVVFGLFGVALAGKQAVFGSSSPLDVSLDKQIKSGKVAPKFGGFGKYCGLHGYVCGYGSCNTGVVGSGPTRQWNACCEVPDPVLQCWVWQCCTYVDQCTTDLSWQPDPNDPCDSKGTQAVGIAWCGTGGGSRYVCTIVSCSGNAATEAQCSCSGYSQC